MILAKDEMKVERWMAWEQNFDTLSGFCGPKEGYVCVFVLHTKPIVGTSEEVYNQNLDS